MTRPCCGQTPRRRQRPISTGKLPRNPKPRDGERVVYVGAGDRVFKGAATGLKYGVSDYRRHLRVDRRDLAALLRDPDFYLEP